MGKVANDWDTWRYVSLITWHMKLLLVTCLPLLRRRKKHRQIISPCFYRTLLRRKVYLDQLLKIKHQIGTKLHKHHEIRQQKNTKKMKKDLLAFVSILDPVISWILSTFCWISCSFKFFNLFNSSSFLWDKIYGVVHNKHWRFGVSGYRILILPHVLPLFVLLWLHVAAFVYSSPHVHCLPRCAGMLWLHPV